MSNTISGEPRGYGDITGAVAAPGHGAGTLVCEGCAVPGFGRHHCVDDKTMWYRSCACKVYPSCGSWSEPV